MLSIENPPPDPPCPCQVLVQLKSGGDGIERPPHKLPLPEVDLLKKPSLDNHHRHHHKTPLSKFSIRDYVFTARGNDIKKSWPFSPKNLQLCLKHGLKDPLPPFEPLGTVRNQSIERCVVESSPFEKQTTRKFGDEPSGSNDHVVLESSNDALSNHNQAGTCIDNSSLRGERGNDLPSTAASVCQSDIDSVLINKQSDLPLETDTTVEASAEVQASGKTRKAENSTRPSGKKCRLIVKFGAHSERSSTEDITSNSTMLSESMASKVCPVCKTFSSSSNTTLNAHIDQCLSDEPTPKWTVDSKLTRHRIKPRKTKTMVDVYATAKPCTLEELDRRNGRCWATASNILNQDSGRLEISDEGKKQRASSINPKDAGDVGAVYVDANGTKIRILSKSTDVPPVSKVGDDPGPSKAFKGNKGSKFFSIKKKRRQSSKHHKYLKLAPQNRKFFSHKTLPSTMVGGQEGCRGVAENCNASEGPDVPKQIKSSDSRNLGERVCSKQAGLLRKPNNQDGHQPSVCRRNVTLDLQVQSDQQHQVDHVAERNCVRKLQSSSDTSSEKCERTEKPVYEAADADETEHSFGRKRVRSSMCGARIRNKVELRSLQNENQLGKGQCHLDKDRLVKSLKTGGNYSSSLSEKVVDIGANSNPNTPVSATAPVSGRSFAFKRFRSSLKKNVSSASRSNLVKNHLMTESRLHFMEETDDEDLSWGPESDQECDFVHDSSDNQRGRKEFTEEMSFGGSSIQGAPSGEQRGRSISWREESMALNSIHSAPDSSSSDETENTDSSARSSDNILDKADGLESFEETVTSLSHSVETKFNKLSNLSENRSNSLQTHEDYNGPLCGGEGLADLTEPSLVGEPRMFCAEVSHDIIGQTGNMGGELDSDAAQLNSFPEVDPIPIPGPPGSFLPSPRGMGSDDFQGNSSLTTSRIQSSQDQFDLVDGDSSDSPISAVSTISNSLEAKSDSKFAEPLAFVDNPERLENYRSGYSTAKSEPLVENGAAFPHTSAGLERTFEGEEFRVRRMSLEKRPLMFKNDDQPCCCQRKDRSSQGFALNYQESQLLRRRTTASMMVPTMGMQIAGNQNIIPDSLDTRPETNSLSSCASLGSEQMVLSVMKPRADSVAFKGFPDAGVKRSDHSNCDPVTPSSSNPVLRLMGKNLMVVNKEENTSVPLGQAQSCAQSNHLTPKFPTSSGTSPCNIENQGGIPFHQPMPQSSLIFEQHPKDLVGKSFDVQLTNGYRNRASLGTPQTLTQFPAGMFFDERMECGLTTSMELYKYAGDYHLPAQPSRPKNRPGPDMEKFVTLDYRHRNGDSAVSSKEVIVIDDAPESETNKFADTAKHFEDSRESSLMIPPGLSIPLVLNHSVSHRNLFSRNQPEDSLRGDPTMAQNKNFNAIPSGRANTVPFRWDCTSEGSGVPQRAPLMVASPSRGHLRPAVYYSPSLS